MKPDWKTAPSWAKYLAMDEDGSWCWFESEPFMGGKCWHPKRNTKCERASELDFRTTLEMRPE